MSEGSHSWGTWSTLLGLSESLPCSSVVLVSGNLSFYCLLWQEEALVNAVSFRDFLKLF